MGLEGVLNLEVLVPDLKESVPADGSEVFKFLRGGVSNPGDPVIVVVLVDGVLADTLHIPEFNASFAASGEDHSVVGFEAAGEHFFGVAVEDVLGFSTLKVPESQSIIPRSGKSKLILA
jgi:hypothetical protein